MLKACVYSIDQGIQVLYTLSLLSLLELASHKDKLTLYTTIALHTDKHTMFNSRFLSFSISQPMYFPIHLRVLLYRHNG